MRLIPPVTRTVYNINNLHLFADGCKIIKKQPEGTKGTMWSDSVFNK